MFIGFATLDSPISFLVLSTSSGVPTASSTTPSYRVYGDDGLQLNGTGSLTSPETGAITGASNESPIVITSAAHGLTTGMRVTVAGVGGNTAANGTFTITVTGANTFSLDGSTGNGSYTTGGTWTTTGLYEASITPTAANGYAQGQYYDVLVNYTISGNTNTQIFRFGVA